MNKILLVLFCLVFTPFAYAANVGTCTEVLEDMPNSGAKVITVTCTADTGNIVYTLEKYKSVLGKVLYQVEVFPLVVPTAASDLYIYDFGADVAAGELVNKATTTGTITILSYKPAVTGPWTIDVDNNAVAAARLVFKLTFY